MRPCARLTLRATLTALRSFSTAAAAARPRRRASPAAAPQQPAPAAAPSHVCDTASLQAPGAGDLSAVVAAIPLLYENEDAWLSLQDAHGVSKREYVEAAVLWRRLAAREPEAAFSACGGDVASFHALARAAAALAPAAAAALDALTAPPGAPSLPPPSAAASPAFAAFVAASLPHLRALATQLRGDSHTSSSSSSLSQQHHHHHHHHQQQKQQQRGASATNLHNPHTWYPVARGMRRRVIFHAGPTNSGKTYNALRALKDAWTGVYCGPLRLLALEVYESLNLDGTPCSLHTGQEHRETPFSAHVSCTVEMLSTERVLDVAVIDEIQMIGDESRGASWTRALLGVPAAEVHVCGDPAAIPVVTALCELTGDALEVKRYERLTSISPEPVSLNGDLSLIQEGDAIVAFSRKNIYAVRRAVELKTAHKCCVVYGSLPAETRSAQARLFNDPTSGCRVLVASDAIGMGLNLNIRRVVFHDLVKFNGVATEPLAAAHVKQIAGRAGRRSSIYPNGFATTLNAHDLPALHRALATPPQGITTAGLFPNPEQLLAFSARLPLGTPLAEVIRRFLTASELSGPYFMCRGEEMIATAALLERYAATTTLEQRAALCLLPANLRNHEVRNFLFGFLDVFVTGAPVPLAVQLPLDDDPAFLMRELPGLEAKASALDMYAWLATKLGARFVDVRAAAEKRAQVMAMLQRALEMVTESAKEASTVKAAYERRRRRQTKLLQQAPLQLGRP